MKKVLTVVAMVLVLGASYAVARTTGVLYGEALSIESIRGTVVASISNAGALVVTSLTNSGAQTVAGAFYQGAAATRSTFTATGTADFHGAVSADDLDATDDLTVGDDTTILGDSYLGAAASRSTHTAAGALVVHGDSSGATLNSRGTITAATNIIATAGFMRLYSRSLAQLMAITPVAVGEMYLCNNCSPVEIAVSTGTGVGGFANAAGAQLD
jgi:hypothetical protein